MFQQSCVTEAMECLGGKGFKKEILILLAFLSNQKIRASYMIE